MSSKTAGFRSFVQYLLKNYLQEDSKFPFDQWNYHESIQNGDLGVTTNPLENINLKLKSKMGHGYLTQKSAFKKLKSFQEDEICLYTSHVSQNKMPKIKAKTLRREKMLMEHLNKFNNLKKTGSNPEYRLFCSRNRMLCIRSRCQIIRKSTTTRIM